MKSFIHSHMSMERNRRKKTKNKNKLNVQKSIARQINKNEFQIKFYVRDENPSKK